MPNIIEILIRASNQASPELKKAAGDLGELSKEAEKVGKDMRKTGLAITAGVTTPLVGLITKSTMAAAEVDTLDLVVKQLGKTAGYSEDEIMGHAEAVRKQGIEAAASREIIAKFVTAQLDAASAADLARVAQNQAVIAGENSTETMERLTDALITGNAQMFRSMKMGVDLGDAYAVMADQLGKHVDELTEAERVQARVNAVMEYGTTIAGTYEAAMGDSFKQMGSFKRYLDDLYVSVGQHFTPALNTAVFGLKDLLGTVDDLISEGGALEPVLAGWGDNLNDVAGLVVKVDDALKNMKPTTVAFIGDMTAATAGMGGLLLVGGQTLIWLSKLAPLLGTSAGVMTGFGLAAYAATVGVIWFNSVSKTHAATIDLLMYSMAGAGESYEDFTKNVEESTEATMNGIKVLAQNAGNFKQMERALLEAKAAGVITNSVYEKMYFDMKNGVVSIDDTREALYSLLSSYLQLSVGMAASDAHMVRVAGNMSYITRNTENATAAIAEHERALARAEVRTKDYSGATDIARQALKDLGIEAEEQARLMDDLAGATENKTAVDLMLEEVNLRLTSLWADNALSAERYNAALEVAHGIAQDYPEALSPLLEMFGEWGGQVQNISDLLHGLPSQVRVDVIQTWYEAQGGTWGGAGNVGAGAGAGVVGDGGSEFARARGGPVYPGRVYRWQEFGPEYLVPQEQGQVMTPGQLAGISGGGGGNIYVTINTPINMADRAFVERELAPYIYDALDRAGRT